MHGRRSAFRGLFAILILLLLYGCTSTGGKNETAGKPRYERSSDRYHKVVKGDTLYAIAWKAGVDYKTLARWNGLRSPYTIYPGQTLRLRPPDAASPRAGTRSQKPRNKGGSGKRATRPVRSGKPAKASQPAVAKTDGLRWIWPTDGRLLSSFKAGDAVRTGIKIAGKKGQKILAAESGKVAYVGGGLIGYGQLIIIKHNNKYLSAYGHNSLLLVKEGETVKKGRHIANMGLANSGRAMLHFEVRKYGKPMDPLALLPKK